MSAIREDIGALLKQSLVYGAGLWATSAAGFVLVPLYIRRLSPHDYGILEILNRVSMTLAGFALAGMVLAVLRLYHMYDSPEQQRQVVRSGVTFTLATSCVVQVIIVVFSGEISRLLLGSPAYAGLCVLAGLRMMGDVGFLLPGTLLRVREQVLLYTVFSVARFVLSIALNLWFVLVLDRGLVGVMEANVISSGLVALTVTGYCLRAVGFGLSRELLKPMLAFGAPVALAGIPGFITENLDRFLLLKLKSASDVGIYALSTRFGMLLSLVVFQPISFVYSAFMFKVAKRDDAARVYGRMTTVVMAIGVWFTVVIAVFAQDIVSVLSRGQAYTLAGAVAPILLLGGLLYGVSPWLEVGIYLRRKTIWKLAVVTIQAAMSAALLVVLIPRWGAIGAAWAFVGSEVVLCGGLCVASQRLFRVAYEWPRMGVLTAALVVGTATGSKLVGEPIASGLVARLVLVAVLAGVVALTALVRLPSGWARREEMERVITLGRGFGRLLTGCVGAAAAPIARSTWSLLPSILVVRYHSISDPAAAESTLSPGICMRPEDFEAQMRALARDASPLPLEAAIDMLARGRRLPSHRVVVTFDDGYADNCEVALPILLEYGIPATFFVTTGWIGTDTEPWFVALRRAFAATRRTVWQSLSGREFNLDSEANRSAARREAARDLAKTDSAAQPHAVRELLESLEVELSPGKSPLMMSWEQVGELIGAGMGIGAHTVCHPNLSSLPISSQEAEIQDSKLLLEANLGRPVEYFSYPSPIDPPCFSRATIELVQRLGFRAALTTSAGLVRASSDRFALPRINQPTVNGQVRGFTGCFLRAALRGG